MATFENEAHVASQIHTQHVAGSNVTYNIYGSRPAQHGIAKDILDDDMHGKLTGLRMSDAVQAGPSSSSHSRKDDSQQPVTKGICLIPHQRNTAFVNRKPEMDRLNALIHSRDIAPTRSTPQLAILYGLGGIGKTSLATELAYQYHEQNPHDAILWIHANSGESIHQSLARIALDLRLCIEEDDQPVLVSRITAWLANKTNPSWLLVFDNADDEDIVFKSQKSLMDTLVKCSRGSLLVTTRTLKVAMKLSTKLRQFHATISVRPMDEHEALSLIKSCSISTEDSSDLASSFDKNAARNIAELVGHLPLAIVQAGTYARENFIPLSKYVQMWHESTKNAQDLLEFEFDAEGRNSAGPDIPNAVAAALALTLDLLARKNSVASDLLSVMTFLHYTAIPESLILDDDTSANDVNFVSAIGELTALSLVSRNSLTAELEVHRLVHITAYRWQLRQDDPAKLEIRANKVLTRLNQLFPRHALKQDRPKLDVYIPHIISYLSRSISTSQSNTKAKIMLESKTAEHLLYQGRTFQAAGLRTSILHQTQRVAGPASKEVLRAKYELAAVLKRLRQYNEAEKLCQVILRECQQGGQSIYGSMTHINTASLLGDLLTERRSYSEADKMMDIARGVAPMHHRDDEEVSIRLEFQAARIKRQEALDLPPIELEKRIQLLTQSKSILLLAGARADAVLGAQSHLKLIGTQHLAGILNDLEEVERAEAMYQLLATTKAEILGEDHVETFQAQRALVWFYLNRGLTGQAQRNLDRLMTHQERVLTEQHPECLKTRRCLARVIEQQVSAQTSRIEEARLQLAVYKSQVDQATTNVREAELKLPMQRSEVFALSTELTTLVDVLWQMAQEQARLLHEAGRTQSTRREDVMRDLERNFGHSAFAGQTRGIREGRDRVSREEEQLYRMQDELRYNERDLARLKDGLGMQESVLAELLEPAISMMHSAIREQRRLIETMLQVLGPEQPETLDLMSECAKTIQKALLLHRPTFAVHVDLARQLLEEVVLQQTQLHEDEIHDDVLSSKALLAAHLHDQGQYQAAEVLERSVLLGEKQKHGNEHVRTLMAMHALAETFAAQATPEYRTNAILLMKQCCKLSTSVLGQGHPDTKPRFELLEKCKSERQMYDDSSSASRSSRIMKDVDDMMALRSSTIHDTPRFSLSVASKGSSRNMFSSRFNPSSILGSRSVVPSALNVVRGFNIGQLIGSTSQSTTEPEKETPGPSPAR